jgi:hypothetical protein
MQWTNLTSFIHLPDVRSTIDKLLRPSLPYLPSIPKKVLSTDVDWTEIGYAFQEWLVCVLKYYYLSKRDIRRYVDYRINFFRNKFYYSMSPKQGRELGYLRRSVPLRIHRGEFSSPTVLLFCAHIAKYEIGRKIFTSVNPVVGDQQIPALNSLINIAETKWLEWLGKKLVFESPVFNTYGHKGLIRAEGDFLVNNTLWEVKTGQQVNKMDLWRQLVGYLALGRIRPVGPYRDWNFFCDEQRDVGLSRIRRVGVYLVRAKYYASWPITDIISARNLEKLETYFRRWL